MKRLKIFKGWHRPLRLIPACFHYMGITRKDADNMLCHTIRFNDDAKYHIDGVDQWDWSKLFGFQYGVLGIHKYSIRFGWRYNPTTDKIEICRILYFDGGSTHTMDYLCSVDAGTDHDYCISHTITNDTNTITFYVDDRSWELSIPKPDCRLRFGCGFYFGGNQRAPQTVSITLED